MQSNQHEHEDAKTPTAHEAGIHKRPEIGPSHIALHRQLTSTFAAPENTGTYYYPPNTASKTSNHVRACPESAIAAIPKPAFSGAGPRAG